MADLNPVAHPVHVLLLVDVLHGLRWNGPTPKGLAGVENVLLQVIRRIPPERYRFSVATFSLGQSMPKPSLFPCPLHVLPLSKTYDWNALRMARRLRRMIQAEKTKIVHTFLESADIWGGLVAKLSGCPILISSRRDMGCFRSSRHAIGYWIINKFVDQVQAVSDEVRNFMIENDGLDPTKIVTLHNGVEIEKVPATTSIREWRAKLGFAASDPIVATVANIRPIKGLDTLVRVASVVCQKFPRARFLIVGDVIDTELLNQLREMVRNFGLDDNVIFLGRSDDVFSLLSQSTLFCLLSRSEGFSNAILEAMASGLPCVVTRVGGNPEAVEEGRNGFLVEPQDVNTAADRILTLLHNPERAIQMGELGRATVANKFSAEAMVNRWADLYDALLASRCN